MPQSTKRALRQNPFTAHREPDTGRWVIIHASSQVEQEAEEQPERLAVEQS
ncbi:MAG: hypothetical protein AAF327_14300 [Cyanobacteria bacterium P01_A01_bin.37]